MFLSDLHIHSKFSDGKLSIPEIVDLYGAKGFGAIAITDHLCESKGVLGKAAVYMNRTLTPAVFPLYLEILRTEADRAWDQYRMLVIPGLELTKSSVVNRSARILALGITEFIPADGDVIEIASQARAQGAVAIAGHSTFLWDRREELASSFDAWEVSSGKTMFNEVLTTALPKLAASGLRRRIQLESWKTVFFCERERSSILQAIRKQDLSFMFYNEENSSNDVYSWLNLGGGRVRHGRFESLRDLAIPQALQLGFSSQWFRKPLRAGVDSETAQGR